MKMTLILLIAALFLPSLAQAVDMPLYLPATQPEFPYMRSETKLPVTGLHLRALRFKNLLPPGGAMRCDLDESPGFGYLIKRSSQGQYTIEVINNGKLEGEKSRMVAERKTYGGDPLSIYLSYVSRYDDYGSYFELIVDPRVDPNTSKNKGDTMFTEAYFNGPDEKDVEYRPVAKKPVSCVPVQP